MAFDVEGARKAGYSDAEIASHLASQNRFDAKAAREAGYTDSELIAHLAGKVDMVSQIPGQDGKPVPKQDPAPEPTLGEKAIGAGEAALSTVTGATTGAAGMIGGTAKGLVDAVTSGQFGTPEGVRTVEQAAARGAEALTYSPRTASGQEQAQAVGQVMQNLVPVAPLVPQMAAAGNAVSAAAPAVATAGRSATAATREIVKAKVLEAAARRAEAAAANDPAIRPTPGTMGSVGAAGTDIAALRRTVSEELPVPVQLTKGQATRDFEQLRFEGEMAKDPTKGQVLREFAEEQNARAIRNFDVFVDQIGAQKTDPVAVGDSVTNALRARAAADKAKVRVAYKNAEKSGEMADPVNLDGLVKHLNESAPDAAMAPLLNTARQWAIKYGIAEEQNGVLVPVHARGGSTLMNERPPGVVSLATAERYRQMINRNTDYEPTNIRQATIIKGLIDEATEGQGGKLYREARAQRRQYAERYENFGLARDLLNNKRGMSDAIVPAERVFQKAILSAPMADVKQIGRLLKSSGEEGRQAWAELQGAAIRYIRDQATKNVSQDSRGNPVLSPAGMESAVKQMDSAGKLDYLFGKKGAEQIRAINELAKIIKTTPPGAVNHSNTASVILSALAAVDMSLIGMGGLPLPVMSGLRILTTHVKDRQIQKRIREALGIQEPPKKVKKPVSIMPRESSIRLPENRTIQ